CSIAPASHGSSGKHARWSRDIGPTAPRGSGSIREVMFCRGSRITVSQLVRCRGAKIERTRKIRCAPAPQPAKPGSASPGAADCVKAGQAEQPRAGRKNHSEGRRKPGADSGKTAWSDGCHDKVE